MRVVSLLPSTSETLRAWGRDPIACSRFCEQPDLPAVGGTKDPDVAAIIALEPDLVVMDEEENRKEDADALMGSGLRVFVTAVRSIDDVAPTLRRLAEAIGVDPGGLDAAHQDRSVAVRSLAFVPIWRRPWMTISGDTYGSSLLAVCGVANVYADATDRYPTVTLDDVKQRRADRVLAPSEPFPFAERHRAELETVAPATFIDGRDLFWWGVRTPSAIARLQADLARD
jgi:ABC-type Fe3+-hydroxamate transport system substrate-binding protein